MEDTKSALPTRPPNGSTWTGWTENRIEDQKITFSSFADSFKDDPFKLLVITLLHLQRKW